MGHLNNYEQSHTEQRLHILERMTVLPGWDQEGSPVVSPVIWARIWNFYKEVKSLIPEADEPFAWPTGTGTAILSWVNGEKKFVLEFDTVALLLSLKYIADAPYVMLIPSWQQALILLKCLHEDNIGRVEELTDDYLEVCGSSSVESSGQT